MRLIKTKERETMPDKLDKVAAKAHQIIERNLWVEDGIPRLSLEGLEELFNIQVEIEPERECPKCLGGKARIGSFYHQIEHPCPTCKGTGRLPAKYKTIGQILEETIRGQDGIYCQDAQEMSHR